MTDRRGPRWYSSLEDVDWHYRFTITLPMELLGIIDSIVVLISLGFIHPSFGLRWGMREMTRQARKAIAGGAEQWPERTR